MEDEASDGTLPRILVESESDESFLEAGDGNIRSRRITMVLKELGVNHLSI